MLRFEKLSRRPADFHRLTGLTPEEFVALRDKTFPIFERLRRERLDRPDRVRAFGGGRRSKLKTFENELLLLLIFYRAYPTVFVLGLLIGLDDANVCRHLKIMEAVLAKARIAWLRKPKGARKINSLKELLDRYPELTDLIGDATEQPVQRPKQKNKRKTKARQRKYYSGKKKQHTIKHQLIVTKGKKIYDVSDPWPGHNHDKTIFISHKTEDKIPKKARLSLDKGYQGLQKEIELEVILPDKANRWHKLTRRDKIRNKKLARERIIVEHVIGGLKAFKILAQRYRHRLENHDRTFRNIAAVWNMKPALTET